MNNMFIPTRIKVGFQTRGDTFTGKLAYVIYYDEKGVLRKEGSWKSWCDAKIPSIEFDNKPQPGFIFNKGVQRSGYWGSGRSVVRVYDPRDFEFEITVDNLIGILMHSDVSKRDIVEPCVFAWAGNSLVLLPTNSEEYQKSMEYTARQSQKMSTKDFVPGHTYQQKKGDSQLVYLGYFEWRDKRYTVKTGWQWHNKGKHHVFRDLTYNQFITKKAADLSGTITGSVHEQYPSLVEAFLKSKNAVKKT